MKMFYEKTITCLNNENGGPNLENMIGIGTSIAVFCALKVLANHISNAILSALASGYNLFNE